MGGLVVGAPVDGGKLAGAFWVLLLRKDSAGPVWLVTEALAAKVLVVGSEACSGAEADPQLTVA